MSIEEDDLTEMIIGAAIDVHRELGPGFLESIYENGLVIALKQIGLKVDQQVEVPIFYRHKVIGKHRLDLVIEDRIFAELKNVTDFQDADFSTVRSYLKAASLKYGLLLNFGKNVIEIKRVTSRISD